MYTFDAKVKTRYSETDKMGVIYHANYVTYYELARSQMLEGIGDYSYDQMEKDGIMMPVIEVNIKYFLPAYYNEELTIRTTLKEMPSARITFYYEILNSNGDLLNSGSAILAFMDSKTRRPCRPPKRLIEVLKPFF